ncbi:MAG: response regulator [Gaiellaceae bacterium]
MSGLVLVADDEGAVRGLVATLLAREGFEVVTAEDGREALEALQARDGELVAGVLDVEMPHVSGDELLRGLRREGSRLPVILSSGYGDPRGVPDDDQLIAFLAKPYRMSDLIACLRGLILAA